MAKANEVALEVLKADTGRATKKVKYGKNAYTGEVEAEGYEVFHHVNYITVADTAPMLIKDVPDVLDDLGLADARRAMDTAHNEMIKTKYTLAIKKALPGYLEGDGKDLLEVSPFDLLTRKQEMLPPPPTPERIQSAIDAPSYTDPAYRASAKAYLTEVLPALEHEYRRLGGELNTARAELARVTREYKRKVAEAEERLQAFNNGVGKEWRKFEIANEGSHTPENFRVTTPACTPIVYYSFPYWEQVEGLRAIKKAIEKYEAEIKKEADPEYIKRLSVSNARQKDPIKSDRTGLGGNGLGFPFFRKK